MGETNRRVAYLQVFFITSILFLPIIVMRAPHLHSLITSVANMMYLFIVIIWLVNGMKTDGWMRLLLLLSSTIILTTVINSGNIRSTVLIWAKVFISCLLLKMIIKKYETTTLKVMKNTLFLLVLINLISMIVMPDGVVHIYKAANRWYSYIVPWWIFGGKNSMFPWLFITNLLAQIDLFTNKTQSSRNYRNYYNYVIIISTLLTAFLSQSSTTIITISLLSMYAFVFKWIVPFKKILNIRFILIFYIILTVVLVTASQNIFFEFVSGVFGKDTTFTGRTFAWEAALMAIKEKPALGYGMLSVDKAREMLGAYAFVHAHNTFLQTLLEGGILLLAEFFFLLKVLGNKIDTLSYSNNGVMILMLWSILALCIQMSFEAYTDEFLLWRILTVMYYSIECVENKYQNVQKNI